MGAVSSSRLSRILRLKISTDARRHFCMCSQIVIFRGDGVLASRKARNGFAEPQSLAH